MPLFTSTVQMFRTAAFDTLAMTDIVAKTCQTGNAACCFTRVDEGNNDAATTSLHLFLHQSFPQPLSPPSNRLQCWLATEEGGKQQGILIILISPVLSHLSLIGFKEYASIPGLRPSKWNSPSWKCSDSFTTAPVLQLRKPQTCEPGVQISELAGSLKAPRSPHVADSITFFRKIIIPSHSIPFSNMHFPHSFLTTLPATSHISHKRPSMHVHVIGEYKYLPIPPHNVMALQSTTPFPSELAKDTQFVYMHEETTC